MEDDARDAHDDLAEDTIVLNMMIVVMMLTTLR